jgi:fructan beta-fructosidase
MAVSTRSPTRRPLAVVLIAGAFLAALGVAPAAADTPQHRPAYHFSPAKNWINDPNGLVFHKGVYHLFFQHQTRSTGMGWPSHRSVHIRCTPRVLS